MVKKRFLETNKKKKMVVKGHKGTKGRPRLSVFRSNRFIYAQLIDDASGKTLVSASQNELILKDKEKSTPKDIAIKVGELLAKKAAGKKISKAIFDRRSYKYHGRVKNLAEGARSAGLTI